MASELELGQGSVGMNGFAIISSSESNNEDQIEIQDTEANTSNKELDTQKDTSEEDKQEDFLTWYVKKLIGPCGASPDRSHYTEWIYTSILGFIGIFINSVLSYWYLTKDFTVENGTVMTYMSGAYAATSVLVYDAKLIYAPVAQPRNVIGGYIVSSFTGVVVRIICGYIGLERWTTAAFAVMFALFNMSWTKTLHPPAGAVALISVIGGPGVWDLGFGYVLTSIGGSFVMVAVALIGNNLIPTRQYPAYWWGGW